MLKIENNITSSHSKIFDVWLAFEKNCNLKINSYIKNLSAAAEVLKNRVKNGFAFSESEKIFLLLKNLYAESGNSFDDVERQKLKNDLVRRREHGEPKN